MLQMVADTSSLILLAKCSLLETVCRLFRVIIPPASLQEAAAKDLVKKYPDAALILGLISKGSIVVQNPGKTKLPLPLSIHQGEKEALQLAIKFGRTLLATDDGKAIKAARFLNVPFIITPKLVAELFRLRRISFKKAKSCLERLKTIGRYSPEIIADALLSLREGKDV
jgi:predicted nucleic acid-binding protein